jgi:hypothetical protein
LLNRGFGASDLFVVQPLSDVDERQLDRSESKVSPTLAS